MIVCSVSKLKDYARRLCYVFSVFKQEKALFDVHSSKVNKAKSKWKALLARIYHNPHISATIANHYNSAFSFHQIPITAGWKEAAFI